MASRQLVTFWGALTCAIAADHLVISGAFFLLALLAYSQLPKDSKP